MNERTNHRGKEKGAGRSEDYVASLLSSTEQHGSRTAATSFPMTQNAAIVIADRLARACGLGSALQIGSHNGALVAALNERGFYAYGVAFSKSDVLSANSVCPGRFALFSSSPRLPFDDKAFDFTLGTVDLDSMADAEVQSLLEEMGRISDKAVYLVSRCNHPAGSRHNGRSRRELEQLCFQTALRKHSAYYLIAGYEGLEHEDGSYDLVLEPIPPAAAALFPLESLRAERDLHMDMTREPGRRSDAHIYRYYQAAHAIRPGDRVLDLACGLGYGSKVLKDMSLAGTVHGVDNSVYAIEYAQLNFAGQDGTLRFECNDAGHFLEAAKDGSYDVIVCFETLEHLLEPRKFLAQSQRVLTPGGRLYLSVPNDWTEDDGKDPNPYHTCTFTWQKFIAELRSCFLIEKLIAQSASRRKENGVWATCGREWRELKTGTFVSEPAEWCVALVMRDPTLSHTAKFYDTVYPLCGSKGQKPTILDFENQYLNPWLIRSAVAIGLRTENKRLLRCLAGRYANSCADSIDKAAMLCVEAYRLLDEGAEWVTVASTIECMLPYVRNRDWTTASPIEVRWAISLLYVSALLQQRAGRYEEAVSSFQRCAAIPFERYSPILATKTVDALFRLGLSYWRERDVKRAEAVYLRGIEAAQRALGADWETEYGSATQLPEFVLSELAEILESAKRCVVALRLLPNGPLTGRVLLAVQWNRPWELARIRVDLRDLQALRQDWYEPRLARLEATVAEQDRVKREWFEPELERLGRALREAEVGREELERDRENARFKERASKTELLREIQDLRACVLAYTENISSLSQQIDPLRARAEELERLKRDWFDPEVKRLNSALEEYERAKHEWFEPQLERRQARIDELEARLSGLVQFEGSRGYRAWRQYLRIYAVPVVGPLLRALRRIVGKLLRTIL